MQGRDATLAYHAERQFGTFSGAQAIEAGFTRRAIRYRVRQKLWIPVVGDSYRVAGGAESWKQPLVGAYLAVGEPSAVAGPPAMAIWGIAEVSSTPELVVPWGRRVSKKGIQGIQVSRTRRWTASEMVLFGPVRITSIARTLLDVAPRLDATALEIALDAAHRKGLELRSFADYLARAVKATIPGAATLAELVAVRDPSRPIETEAETRVFAILRRAGLPLPVPQYWVRTRSGPKRLDFAYPEQRVAIEFDSYEWHGAGRQPFDADKAKDNELGDIGFDRRHITWTMVKTEPAEVMFTVGRSLGLEPRAWRPSPGG